MVYVLCCVNGRSSHHTESRQELDDSRKDKSFPLFQTEELKDEDKETHTAQDSGQYHGGLDSLKIGCISGCTFWYVITGCVVAVIPEI